MKVLFRVADNRRPDSIAHRLRVRRITMLWELIDPLPAPVRVLDIGGTEQFWRRMGGLERDNLEITLLNIKPADAPEAPNVRAIIGDARDLIRFEDDAFDVVFSNSVIEHLGDEASQRAMAAEVRRVGRRHWVQTPNRYFPIEPHFLIPGFQFLPVSTRVALVRRFALGYHAALPDPAQARAAVEEIRLLDDAAMRRLFPASRIWHERVLGLTKSLVAIGGW